MADAALLALRLYLSIVWADQVAYVYRASGFSAAILTFVCLLAAIEILRGWVKFYG